MNYIYAIQLLCSLRSTFTKTELFSYFYHIFFEWVHIYNIYYHT